MQLTQPIDCEWALAQDIAEFLPQGWDVGAQPTPDSMDGSVCMVRISCDGGRAVTAVSDEFTVSIDVWAGSGDDYAQAVDAAAKIAGVVGSMPIRSPSSGREWKTAEPYNRPQPNPDRNHSDIPRVSQIWAVGIRGDSIGF